MVFPCSAALWAVPREPLLSAASATTTPKLNALTMRFPVENYAVKAVYVVKIQ